MLINSQYILSAADDDYFATALTGATWSLSETATPDGLAYKPILTNNSATDHSGKTAFVTGRDADGVIQTEIITLPNASPAATTFTKYYSEIISIVPSATIGSDTMKLGFSAAFASKTISMDRLGTGASLAVELFGIATYNIFFTLSDVQRESPPFRWQNIANSGEDFYNATESKNGFTLVAHCAYRLEVSSYTGSPIFYFDINQTSY